MNQLQFDLAQAIANWDQTAVFNTLTRLSHDLTRRNLKRASKERLRKDVTSLLNAMRSPTTGAAYVEVTLAGKGASKLSLLCQLHPDEAVWYLAMSPLLLLAGFNKQAGARWTANSYSSQPFRLPPASNIVVMAASSFEIEIEIEIEIERMIGRDSYV